MLGVSLPGNEFQPLNISFQAQGWVMLVGAILGLLPAWVLAGGDWRRGVAGAVPFALAVGLRDQAVVVGMQVVVPGVVVWLATALLPYTAAAHPEAGILGALVRSVRGILAAPLAWAVTLTGGVGCELVELGILALGGSHPLTSLIDPCPASLPVRALAYAGSALTYGLTWMVGATLHHRATRD